MRFVLDTNVVVSALLLSSSTARRCFDKAFNHGPLLISRDTFEEVNEVLGRSVFRRYVTDEERTLFLALYLEIAELISPDISIEACRDKSDNKFLECAVSGKADVIISGDRDLLVLDPFEGIRIITPAEFMSLQL